MQPKRAKYMQTPTEVVGKSESLDTSASEDNEVPAESQPLETVEKAVSVGGGGKRKGHGDNKIASVTNQAYVKVEKVESEKLQACKNESLQTSHSANGNGHGTSVPQSQKKSSFNKNTNQLMNGNIVTNENPAEAVCLNTESIGIESFKREKMFAIKAELQKRIEREQFELKKLTKKEIRAITTALHILEDTQSTWLVNLFKKAASVRGQELSREYQEAEMSFDIKGDAWYEVWRCSQIGEKIWDAINTALRNSMLNEYFGTFLASLSYRIKRLRSSKKRYDTAKEENVLEIA